MYVFNAGIGSPGFSQLFVKDVTDLVCKILRWSFCLNID